MARRTPPSFDFYPDDFIGGCEHLSAAEVGIYIRLLVHQFRRGFIPNDMDRIRTVAHILGDTEWEQMQKPIGFVLSEKFVIDENGNYVNERMAQEREKSHRRHAANVANGRKGGRPRKLRKQSSSEVATDKKPKRNPSLNPNETQGLTQTITQTKPSGKKEVGSSISSSSTNTNGQYTLEFEDFWSACPRKTGKGPAADSFAKALARVKAKGIEDPAKYITSQMVEFATLEWPPVRIADDAKHCPHPATWLNQDRFYDEPCKWKPEGDSRGKTALNQGVVERFMERHASD